MLTGSVLSFQRGLLLATALDLHDIVIIIALTLLFLLNHKFLSKKKLPSFIVDQWPLVVGNMDIIKLDHKQHK